MIVAVLGNYNSTNLGDDMYLHILRSRYPQHQFVPQHEVSGLWPDFIIYGGGGVLREGEGRHVLLRRWVKKYRVPYCVMSVGSSVGDDLRFKEYPFPGAEFITVRDRVANKAIDGSVLLPDLAWNHRPHHEGEGSRNLFGIMLRHSTGMDSFALVLRTRMEMPASERYLFFSTYGPLLGDRAMVHPVRAGFDSEYSVYPGKNPAEYLELYKKCSRVLAMPMHGIIFAAIYGVPWATWPYDRKVEWLLEDIGGEASKLGEYGLIWNETPRETVAKLRTKASLHLAYLDEYLA